MKQRNITGTIVPDKRRIKDDVICPLKLRITYTGSRKYYATGYSASLKDYKLMKKNNVRGELRKTNLLCSNVSRSGHCVSYTRGTSRTGDVP